jgi:hypothetical protein
VPRQQFGPKVVVKFQFLVEFQAMRTNVAPFLWFLAAFTFAVVWGQQHKTAYLLLAVVFAILAVRSYAATKKGAV